MRARIVSDEQILKLHKEGLNQSEIGKILGVSNVAIHKRLKKICVMQQLEGLTPKEQRFCLAVASGKSRTEAAMESYNCTNRASAKAIQNKLKDKPEIQNNVKALFELHKSSLSHRIGILAGHIDNQTDPHVSLKGLDMSFRLDGSYAPEKREHSVEYDISSIINRIDKRFSQEIDVTPKDENLDTIENDV